MSYLCYQKKSISSHFFYDLFISATYVRDILGKLTYRHFDFQGVSLMIHPLAIVLMGLFGACFVPTAKGMTDLLPCEPRAGKRKAFLPRRASVIALLLCLGALPVLPAMGQTFTGGAIGGRVTDPQGSPLAGVQVTATEVATNTEVQSVSGADGEYLIPRLKPGVYRVSFTGSGFKEEIDNGVQIQLDLTFRLDKQMALGTTSEVVQVSASETSVNYDSPEISSTLSAEQVSQEPIIGQSGRGRSPYLLAVLSPGVTSTSNSNNNVNNFSLGGGRPVTNEILIDGLPSTNPSDNTYTYTPSPESIEELKVITIPFSAEFGHTGGGVILANTHHGSSEFHGSLYSYFNNRLLNARNYFQTAPNLRYDQNDPGATFSGPVILPHLLKGKHTFFFIDFNYTRSAEPSSAHSGARTPTAAERAGDFSADTGITIYDPATTTAGTDSQGNQIVIRQPFPNNTIPAARIDSVAAQLVKYYPQPNGNYGGGINYQIIPTSYQQILQGIVRVDHTISEKDSVFARYGRYNPNANAVNFFSNLANPSNTNGWYDNQFVANETHIFGPRASNDFRFGFVQEVNYTIAGGGFPASLGLQNVPQEEFPNIDTSNFIQLGASGAFHDRDRSYIFVNNFLLARGKHLIKIGGDYRHQLYKFYNGNSDVTSGIYNFDNTFTETTQVDANGSYVATTGGFDLADLLLGLATQTTISEDLYTYRLVNDSASAYVQDDWKVLPKLTVNLGLRWEFDGPTSEANNQFASFNPAQTNSQTGTPGDAIFAGRDGAPSHFAPNIFYNVLPRLGAVWSPFAGTVVHAGFGAYRLPSIGFSYIGPLSIYQKNATLQSTNGYTPAFQLAQGVPSVPFYRDANGNPEVPASLSNPTADPVWIDSRSRTPYNLVWQFGLQEQFGSWFAQANYVYNHGIKLPVQYTVDQLLPSQFTAPNFQSLRPFPQYDDVQFFTNQGGSNYQAIETQLEHKWSNGFVVSGSYTFSKLIDDVDANDRVNGAGVQNAYDLHAERGIASSDVPQRLVTNFVYQLPFGRGGKFANDTPVLRDVIGGWQVAGIVQFQIGQPIRITQSNQNPTAGAQRPDLIGKPTLARGARTITAWFNTGAFTPVPQGQLGTSPRFPLHGPGLEQTDLSVKRTFHLADRLSLNFRVDYANVFNHPEFGNPDANVGSVGSLNSDFGFIHGAQAPRIGQLSANLVF